MSIGDTVIVTIVGVDRGKVRLGIDAPRDVAIYRQELLPAAEADAIGRRAEAARDYAGPAQDAIGDQLEQGGDS